MRQLFTLCIACFASLLSINVCAQDGLFLTEPMSLVQEFTLQNFSEEARQEIRQEEVLAFLVTIQNSQVLDVKHLRTKRPSRLKLQGIEFPSDEVKKVEKHLKKTLKLVVIENQDLVSKQEVIYLDMSKISIQPRITLGSQY